MGNEIERIVLDIIMFGQYKSVVDAIAYQIPKYDRFAPLNTAFRFAFKHN